ncbi:MAG: sensor histidine kinase [Campylobacterales bacterium]
MDISNSFSYRFFQKVRKPWQAALILTIIADIITVVIVYMVDGMYSRGLMISTIVAFSVGYVDAVISLKYIAAIEQKQNELNKKNKEIKTLLIEQSKLAVLGEMIDTITHQWKQPLTIISLQSSKVENQKAKQIIKDQITFMNQTVDDFQDFFGSSNKIASFSPKESIKTVINILKLIFEEEKIGVSIDEKDEFLIMGFQNEFKQVVLNLFVNSIEAFKTNNIKKKKINIELKVDSGSKVVEVSDSAGGIPRELLPDRLFEHKISTKKRRNSGNGLYICKMIIEKVGGKIVAYNSKEGAVFSIRFGD